MHDNESKIYLSIDLDYWAQLHRGPHKTMAKVLEHVGSFVLVRDHHRLLRHINYCGEAYGCRHLINIDTHSDFPGTDGCSHLSKKLPELTEGTWAEHVAWKASGHFEWRRPRVLKGLWDGYCHADYKNPFFTNHHGWESREIRIGLGEIPWDRVAAVGVCTSPYWVREISHTLPYMKRYPHTSRGVEAILAPRIERGDRLLRFGSKLLNRRAESRFRGLKVVTSLP